MKITRRQEEFIKQLIDLNHEFNGPIHYSVLADRLGVSPYTAYDMLCLLEDKGMVTSEYQLSAEKNGPGRAERLFYPVESPQEREDRLVEQMGGEAVPKEDLKLFVIEKIRKGELYDKDLAEELLALVPFDEQEEMSYCTEVMKIASHRAQQIFGRKNFMGNFPDILLNNKCSRENLSLLGGFAFGILAQENIGDDEWDQKLFSHVQNFLDIVTDLSPDNCQKLAASFAEIFTQLSEQPS
jgi:hypothetical protein